MACFSRARGSQAEAGKCSDQQSLGRAEWSIADNHQLSRSFKIFQVHLGKRPVRARTWRAMNVRGDLQNGRHQTHGVLMCLDRSLISIFSTFKCKAEFKSGAAFLDVENGAAKSGAPQLLKST